MNEKEWQKGEKPRFLNTFKIGIIVAIILVVIAGIATVFFIEANAPVSSETLISPSPTKESYSLSSKTVDNFFKFWLSASQNQDEVEAKKAADLLTISAQARLITEKDAGGQAIAGLIKQLNFFFGVEKAPFGYEIISAEDAELGEIEVKVELMYDTAIEKKIYLSKEDIFWLINEVTN